MGAMATSIGKVPKVSSSLAWGDNWGAVKVRFKIGRMRYAVEPGLYALGDPNDQSPVLATANYKMTFDWLRKALPGLDAWVLVLDTKGVNVWCSAGKGTFGTEELVQRIEASGLAQVVSHREIILPQLAAPGVAAHQVKRLSGFKVIYGPIRAEDIKAFLDAGLKATPEMRQKTFTIGERAVLIPGEMVDALKRALYIFPIFFLLGGFGGGEGYWLKAWHQGSSTLFALLSAILAGAVLPPALLPFLPGRAFSLKGSILGIAAALIFLVCGGSQFLVLEGLAWLLMIPAAAAYMAMEFTGCSTYTSLSGVRREMRFAVPMQIAAGVGGLILWIGARLLT